MEPPKFDGAKPPKLWFDPAAKDSIRRNIAYDRVISYAVNGALLFDENDKPLLEGLVLNKEEAATLNIPGKGLGMANIPGADKPEIPPPLSSQPLCQPRHCSQHAPAPGRCKYHQMAHCAPCINDVAHPRRRSVKIKPFQALTRSPVNRRTHQ